MNNSYLEGYDGGYKLGGHPDDNPYCYAHESYDEEQWDKGYHQGRIDWRNGWSYHPYPGSY